MEWTPYQPGVTALYFGSVYLAATAKRRLFVGTYVAHRIPTGVAWVCRVDLPPETVTPPTTGGGHG